MHAHIIEQTTDTLVIYGPLIMQQLQEIKAALPEQKMLWKDAITTLGPLLGVLFGGGITWYVNKYTQDRAMEREERNAARERETTAMLEARDFCLEFLKTSTVLQQKLLLIGIARTQKEMEELARDAQGAGFELQLQGLSLTVTCPQEIIDCSYGIQNAWKMVLSGEHQITDPEVEKAVIAANMAFDAVIQLYFKDYLAKQIKTFPSTTSIVPPSRP